MWWMVKLLSIRYCNIYAIAFVQIHKITSSNADDIISNGRQAFADHTVIKAVEDCDAFNLDVINVNY